LFPHSERTGLSRPLADGLLSKLVSIRPMRLAVQELETGPLHRLRDWPNELLPQAAGRCVHRLEGRSGPVYRDERLGQEGPGPGGQRRQPGGGQGTLDPAQRPRVGACSGDRFCVYVCDRFLVPALSPSQQQQLALVPCRLTASPEHWSAALGVRAWT
jgi:hypothetical protein